MCLGETTNPVLLMTAKNPQYSAEGDLRLARTDHLVGNTNTLRFDPIGHDQALLNTSG